MIWDVKFKLAGKKDDWDTTKIKNEIISWLEDLGFKVKDIEVTNGRRTRTKKRI